MAPIDSRCPCASDALSCATALTINGRTFGITGLCDTLAEVRLRGLRDDTWTRPALIERGECTSDIPRPLRDDHADALPLSYDIRKRRAGLGLVCDS